MTIRPLVTLFFLSFAIALAASLVGFKLFVPWEQVVILWNAAVDPFTIFGHPHMVRYSVAYPGFLLEEFFPGFGFSLYICVFLALNFVFFRLSSLLLFNKSPHVLVYLLFFLFHAAMNGRGVIAWTGWLSCVSLCSFALQHRSLTVFHALIAGFSLILCAVTSGVFIVAAIAFISTLLFRLRLSRRTGFLRLLLVFVATAPLGYFAARYFIQSVEKNLDFYGGGIEGAVNMFTHGLGGVFYELDLSLVFVLFLALYILAAIALSAVFGGAIHISDRFMILAIFGGFFGFTILTLIVPLFLLRLQDFVWRFWRGGARYTNDLAHK